MTDAVTTGAGPEPTPDKGVVPKPKRNTRGRTACLLGIVFGLAGLAASRLGWLWINFDVFAHFTLHFALIAFAFFAGYFMPRIRVLTGFVLIVAGVLAIGLWPHLASSRMSAPLATAEGERALKLMTFNTWFSNDQVDAVGAEIRRQNPDIVFMAEFGPNKRRLIGELKDTWPYAADCLSVDYCNLAILSKFPILENEGRALWKGPPLLRVRFGPELGGLILTGTHTIRFPHQVAQFTQLKELARFLEADAGQPIVVMGDFNATPFSHKFADGPGRPMTTVARRPARSMGDPLGQSRSQRPSR